jgi:hypothetical protein
MVTAIEETVTDGQQRIAELEATIKDLNSRMEAIAPELSKIQRIREDREQFLAETRQAFLHRQHEHDQAAAFANLAHGHPNEKQALKKLSSAKQAMDSEEKVLSVQEKGIKQEEAEDSAREQEFKKQLHLLQSERDTQVAALHKVQLGMDKAHNDLGEEKHSAILAGHQTKKQLVDDLTAQLVAAKVDLLMHHEKSVQDLQPWSALQQDIKSLMPADNATVRVLEAEIHYITTLLDDASGVDASVHLASLKRSIGYSDVWSKAIIPEQEVISAIRRQPQTLQIRRDVLQRLLEEYRAYLLTEPLY